MIILCLLPFVAVLASFVGPIDHNVWDHLQEYLLLEYALNTLKLLVVVIASSTLIGVTLAALVSFGDFPGRSFFMGFLLTPLAFPAYIYAFVFTGLFSYSGLLGFTGFYSFRSFWGLAFTLTLSCYPYIYLLSLQGFSSIGSRYYEISLVNGFSPFKSLVRGAIPISLPWIMTGVILVSLETISDFGAASVFSYDTMTIGVYKAWFGFFSLPTAMRLSTILIGLGFLLLIVKQFYQNGKLYENTANSQPVKRTYLGWKVSLLCGLFIFIAVALPLTQLLLWSNNVKSQFYEIIKLSIYTLAIALVASILINLLGFLSAATMRMSPSKWNNILTSLPLIGYGLPGTVIATIIFFLFGGSYGFVGSLLLLILAYFIRFFPLAITTISGSGKRVPLDYEELAILANVPRIKILRRLSAPLLRSGWVLSFILLFIEIVKEMPMTLIMRPLGYATLATKVFELSSEGEWSLAAMPSMVIVLISSISVVWIISTRMGNDSNVRN